MRKYFSIKARYEPKKFRFPLTEFGGEINQDALKIYDELQYC